MKKNVVQAFDVSLAKSIIASAKSNNIKIRPKPNKKREDTR